MSCGGVFRKPCTEPMMEEDLLFNAKARNNGRKPWRSGGNGEATIRTSWK